MQVRLRVTVMMLLVLSPLSTYAQSVQEPSGPVPRLITITGVFHPADGQPLNAVETVTLSIYADQVGGAPIWQETQTVTVGAQGRYSLLLGASRPDGIPAEVFSREVAHWLGTVFERPGEVEGARVRVTSVPYALRAAEADTLGGRPASDYQLAPRAASDTKDGQANAATTETGAAGNDVVLAGTTNFLAKYVNTADVGNSGVFEAADGSIGLGTTTPFDRLHVRYNNNTGDFTGLAVQNTNGGALAYSGMLFFDHTNALTQFQGYNNATHEYRINNIARVAPGGAFNGSINFMLGGTSKFFIAPNGNIGIGTTSPSALLEVSNALPGGPANMWMTSFTNFLGPYYLARRSRGTPAAPTAVQNGDGLSGIYGAGYGTTGFGPASTGGMTIQAAQNWTDTAQGTALTFITTPFNSNAPVTRMTLDPSGNLGIGTLSPQANLEVSNSLAPASPANVILANYGNSPSNAFLLGRKARGTGAAPAQVLNGDGLMSISGRGYGTTQFGVGGGATIGMSATENYTDTAMGARIQLFTTPNGTTALTPRMTIDQNGFVGIGNNFPTAMLDIARNGTAEVIGTSYGGHGMGFMGRAANGTFVAPTRTLFGNELAEFTAEGYDGTGFDEVAGWGAWAAEDWTDTAHGTLMAFFATPLGGNDGQLYMSILPNGNLGIGTPTDVNGFPTATDKLQVFGDARVGNAGTNGCLKRFDGTALAGTCSSDRRFKKDITPFAPVLGQLTALQPVHYYWRAEDFPTRHFGNSRSYGLIAQDVEAVLPELVATDSDGYKAVDYSELPLLTIQALKELKAENETLKERVADLEELKNENVALKQRLAEIERLLGRALGDTPRR